MKISFNGIVPTFSAAIYPTSLVVLKSYLQSQAFEMESIFSLSTCDESEDEIFDRLYAQDVDVMLFSAYMWNFNLIKNIGKRLKRADKHCFLIVGGPGVFHIRDEELIDNDWCDLLIRGDGEEALHKALTCLQNDTRNFEGIPGGVFIQNGHIFRNDTAEFDIRQSVYDIFLDDVRDTEIFSYETSRGCPFKCAYCSWPKMGRISYYPMEKIENDFKHIFSLPKLRMLGFVDSDLAVNKKRCLLILRLFNKLNAKRKAKRLVPLAIHLETNLENFTDEIIEEISKIPQTYPFDKSISCGLQSLDKEVLSISNRKLNEIKLIENYNKLRNKGFFDVMVEIIHGLPGDSKETYRKTLDSLISEINVDYFFSNHFCVIENSYFRQHAKDYGLQFSEENHHRLISSNTFPQKDLDEIGRYVYYLEIIYLTPLRKIKILVDKKFTTNKLKVYDNIIEFLDANYRDYFVIGDVYDLVRVFHMLESPESLPIRKTIIQKVKKVIETFVFDE
ncbi:MAG: radical SAM protein [Desulfobacteraceae bacterium]|jgi:radical SAM superfamily enzyme YgiQ (UPF0313 family)